MTPYELGQGIGQVISVVVLMFVVRLLWGFVSSRPTLLRNLISTAIATAGALAFVFANAGDAGFREMSMVPPVLAGTAIAIIFLLRDPSRVAAERVAAMRGAESPLGVIPPAFEYVGKRTIWIDLFGEGTRSASAKPDAPRNDPSQKSSHPLIEAEQLPQMRRGAILWKLDLTISLALLALAFAGTWFAAAGSMYRWLDFHGEWSEFASISLVSWVPYVAYSLLSRWVRWLIAPV